MRVEMKPLWGLFWVKGQRPLKIIPMHMEVGIPLTHQSLGPAHEELPGLLLQTPHHWPWCLYPADMQGQVFSDPEVTISTVLEHSEMFIPPSRQCILACSQMVLLCCTTHDTCLCVAHAVQDTALYNTEWYWILYHTSHLSACDIHVFHLPREH
jgi:hypothetical protein